MNTLEKKFEKMGARVKVHGPGRPNPFLRRQRQSDFSDTFRVNILKVKEGSYFDILNGGNVEVLVLDVVPKDRHLVLMARTPGERNGLPDNKSKFLCGHDERDWFVAAVPEKAPVSSVATAKQALKPEAVVAAEERVGVKPAKRQKRKNAARKRQGEWFFIPAPNAKIDEKLILKNEPLQRGRGKPPLAEELIRTGGELVYVGIGTGQNGMSEASYKALSSDDRKRRVLRAMTRNPKVYVRGSIRHSDHKTIHLDCWHLVEMNTESQSRAMANVAFLD